jgi:hypothetical protein
VWPGGRAGNEGCARVAARLRAGGGAPGQPVRGKTQFGVISDSSAVKLSPSAELTMEPVWDGKRWRSSDCRWVWTGSAWKQLAWGDRPGHGIALGVVAIAGAYAALVPSFFIFLVSGLGGFDPGVVISGVLGIALLVSWGAILAVAGPRRWYIWPLVAWAPLVVWSINDYFTVYSNPNAGGYHRTDEELLTIAVVAGIGASLLIGAAAGRIVARRRSKN